MFQFLLPALIGGAASIYSASQATSPLKKAMRQQQRQYEESVARIKPYLDASNSALETYKSAIGLNGPDAQRSYYSSFLDDPGFKAAQDAALEDINRSAAARGMSLSGNALSSLYNYGERNRRDAYDRRLGQIGGIINQGLGALNTVTSLGASNANNQSDLLAKLGQYNALGVKEFGNTALNALNNYNLYDAYNRGYTRGVGGV